MKRAGDDDIDVASPNEGASPQKQSLREIGGNDTRCPHFLLDFRQHLVINDRGELLAFCLTPGNRDDRAPVPRLAKSLFGKLIADKGYLSQSLFERLFCDRGVQLITRLRKNMANALMDWGDQCLLRKRAIIESVNDQLKNISQIEHSRHRSPTNFLVNLVGGLIAYCFQPKKPSLGFDARLGLTS